MPPLYHITGVYHGQKEPYIELGLRITTLAMCVTTPYAPRPFSRPRRHTPHINVNTNSTAMAIDTTIGYMIS